MIYLHREIYKCNNGQDYTIMYSYSATTNVWSVYAIDKNRNKYILAITTTVNKPSIAIMGNVVYIAGYSNTMKYAFFPDNSTTTVTSGTMANAPTCEFLIKSKNRLFGGGRTTFNYTTGTASFVQNDKTVTGASTLWKANLRAGDRIGTGTSPTVWYTVASITDDTHLELTADYVAASSGAADYKAVRTTDKFIHYSAEECFTDWIVPGVFGGDTASFFILGAGNTGLHNFDDVTLFFTDTTGYFIEGTTVADWQIPKRARLPVGCVSHDSIHSKNGYLGFMSQNGYFITKGGQLATSALEAAPFSTLIQGTIDDIDLDELPNIYAFDYKDLLLISVPAISNYSDTGLGSYTTGTVNVVATSTYSTGDVTATLNSRTITGNGTTWTTANAGQGFLFGIGASPTVWYTIESIDSTTQVTLTQPYAGATVSGSAYSIKLSKTVIGEDGVDWEGNIEPGDAIKFGSETDYYEIAAVDPGTSAGTCTISNADPAVVTLNGHGLKVGRRVQFTTTDTLPTGLSISTDYFVIEVDTNTFQLATTYDYAVAGTPKVATTGAGAGTHTLYKYDTLTLALSKPDAVATGTSYVIQKHRNNRLLGLDTRTNMRKKSFGWTIFDNIYASSFCLFNGQLYYGSSIDNYIYKYDIGGLLYGEPFNASFTTKVDNCGMPGVAKAFKSVGIIAKGVGRIKITPRIDGVAKDQMCYDFNTTAYTTVYFPNAKNPDATVANYPNNAFGGFGEEISLLVELEGSNETLACLPPLIGFLPLSRREVI